MRGRRDRIISGSSGRIAVRNYRWSLSAALVFLSLSAVSAQTVTRAPVQTVAGMPPIVDANNLYSEAGPGKLSPATAGGGSPAPFPHPKTGGGHVVYPPHITAGGQHYKLRDRTPPHTHPAV